MLKWKKRIMVVFNALLMVSMVSLAAGCGSNNDSSTSGSGTSFFPSIDL